MRLFLASLVVLSAGCTCATPPRTGVPSYSAPHVAAPLAIDGDLADWPASAPRTEVFVDTMNGGAAYTPSTARLAWDEHALYVAFEITDRYLASSFTHGDEHLWEADCAELMIDRGSDGEDYVELQVSPSNVVFDTWFDTYRAPPPVGHLDWSAALETAVRTHGTPNDATGDDGYEVEIAIPWATLVTATGGDVPSSGEEWRIALYVLDLLAEGATASAWSAPMVGDFHVPDRFGRVVLAD